MSLPRIKRTFLAASFALALICAVLWVRSYWYNVFLCYEAGAAASKGGHSFWSSSKPGAFDVAIRWEEYNTKTMHDRGLWRFCDTRRKPPYCAVIGESETSFLGFEHWVVESPGSYRYNYTWIPYWFPTLLFALVPLLCLARPKLAPVKPLEAGSRGVRQMMHCR